MVAYQELYGSDADGNRGKLVWNFELDSMDDDLVRERIVDKFIGYERDELPEYTTIELYAEEIDDEVEFEVCLQEYLTEEDYVEMESEQWKH